MNTGARLGAYGLVLAAALGGGAAVGTLAGPIDIGSSTPHGGGHSAPLDPIEPLPAGGLLVSQNGYTFAPEDRLADAGRFSFTITGPDGRAVTAFDTTHDRELHLIVASRDLRQFVHLHPERDGAGRWSVELPTLPPGPYRAFADFHPTGGEALTLGTDLVAPGPLAAPEVLRTQVVDTTDGYDVRLEGDVTWGAVATLTVTVRREGALVVTEPYLGAAGHLVALRDGDLAYLHVHPLDAVPAGPVRFAVEVPSPGTYGLFFDFVADGAVHSARFVVTAVLGADSPAVTHAAH